MKQHLFKFQSVEAFANYSFGTRLRQWSSLQSLDEDGFLFPIAVRYKHPLSGGGPAYFQLHRNEIENTLKIIESRGFDLKYVYFNECAPDNKAILQGEVCDMEDGSMCLKYNTMRTDMRTAMKSAKEIKGRLRILTLLKEHMSDSSYEDFMVLLEEYPYHVIEFTCFEVFVGHLKGRNTIFWDARFH